MSMHSQRTQDIELWPSPLFVYLTTCPSNLQQGLSSPVLENIEEYQSCQISTYSSPDSSHEDRDRAQPINLGTTGWGQIVTSCADGTLTHPSQTGWFWDEDPPSGTYHLCHSKDGRPCLCLTVILELMG